MEKEREDLVYLLMRAMRIEFQYMRANMEELDLYPGQPQLLLALRTHEGVSQRELSQILHISPATLTVMLRRMDDKRLIVRTADPSDMRVMRLRLTQQGEKKVGEIERVLDRMTQKLETLFAPSEIDTALEMLKRVCRHAEEGKMTRR